MEKNDLQKLQMDYQHTINQFKMLADIRFKLLAFVPTLAGAAVAFFTKTGRRNPPLLLAFLDLL